MKAERLGSPEGFANTVVAHLAGFAQEALPLPSAADLTALIEATFYASLHEEEARHTEFTIAWDPAAHDCAYVFAIASPVHATPKNLARLAPATRQEATSIAIRREGGALVAWALLEQNATAKQPFTIRVLGSGVLRVDYAGVPRALYARGETYLMGGAYGVKSPAQVLTRTFSSWSEAADPHIGIDRRAEVVARIATRMLEHRHGGMLLLIPANTTPVGVRVHYPMRSGEDVLVRRHHDAKAIDLLARLTAIDNAVLLDTELRLRGFGVQVIEGDAPQMTFEHADPYTDDVHVDDLSTFKGTRHPAGVIFCMRQPQAAAAIIASQDGRLSLAVKNARGGVEVVGSYERAFGWL